MSINCGFCNTLTTNKRFCSRECYISSKIVTNKKLVSNCFYCGILLNRDNAYRRLTVIQNICKTCSGKQQSIRKYNLKKFCVDYKGGQCCRCGYNQNLAALQFHHLDPTKKDFNFATYAKFKFNEEIKSELDKCILLCANCHHEEHHPEYGNLSLPKNTGSLTPIKIYKNNT